MSRMHVFSWAVIFSCLFLGLPLLATASDQADGGYKKIDIPDTPFVEPTRSLNKIHMHLGLGSLLAAAAAGLSAPDSEGATASRGQSSKKSFHYYAANTAVALGGAAIVTGLVAHLDDIHLDNGLMDPDTLHMILTVAGTAAYMYAVAKAPKVLGGASNGHAAAGIAGASMMLTGVVLEW
ncbi:MAG: hypothetical protein Q9M31_10395 [Mariprofundus sp.]|nr:hypothetical protein [Mariprofundus sp.]